MLRRCHLCKLSKLKKKNKFGVNKNIRTESSGKDAISALVLISFYINNKVCSLKSEFLYIFFCTTRKPFEINYTVCVVVVNLSQFSKRSKSNPQSVFFLNYIRFLLIVFCRKEEQNHSIRAAHSFK